MSPEEQARILEGAAERILQRLEAYACWAIEDCAASPQHASALRIIFEDIFGCQDIPKFHMWEHNDYESRIFALLFAAEMIRTNSQP